MHYFFGKFETEGGRLTLKGFMDLYYKESYHHPKNVWEELVKFGYDENLVRASIWFSGAAKTNMLFFSKGPLNKCGNAMVLCV